MIREQIQETEEYQALTAAEQAAQQERQAKTVGDALDPVVSWEKGDVEFWMQVIQLIVLLMILRELRGGGL